MSINDPKVIESNDDYIDINWLSSIWKDKAGRLLIEKDYHVGGEIWRVHKNDPDPFPSKPHAHCIAGPKRLLGCKLHLGTAELFNGKESIGRYLEDKKFDRLIELVHSKFPEIILPLP